MDQGRGRASMAGGRRAGGRTLSWVLKRTLLLLRSAAGLDRAQREAPLEELVFIQLEGRARLARWLLLESDL